MKILLGLLGVLLFMTLPAMSEDGRFVGICDASAALALDADRFIVADDETNTLSVFGWADPGVRETIDLTDFLDNRKSGGGFREADIEGAAVIGERVFWITSHGRGKDGDVKKGRYRLFSTSLAQPGDVGLAAGPFKGLLEAILAEKKFDTYDLRSASMKAPKEKGGFNIEALAASPSGQLMIGFRNPLAGSDALVIPLLNPVAVVDGKEAPVFADAAMLDLGGLGLRSMEFFDGRYLVVAGGVGEDDDDPVSQIRAWGGPQAGRETTPVSTLPGGFNAEALFVRQQGADARLIALSDDGDVKVDGKKCKDEDVPVDRKAFRWLAIDPPRL